LLVTYTLEKYSMINSASMLESLYVNCMNCGNTALQCPGIWKNISAGLPPRGFFFKVAPVKLLIVAKNPGHPLKGEVDLYRGRIGSDLFFAYRRFQKKVYPDPGKIREFSTRFHKTLFRYISYFLDIPGTDIYLHAAHTNLVKCSTRDEQARLKPKTMMECYTQYLRTELELLRPKVLLALGREVERFLIERQTDHNLPVVYIKHPSYRYRREEEKQILSDIKQQIVAHL